MKKMASCIRSHMHEDALRVLRASLWGEPVEASR